MPTRGASMLWANENGWPAENLRTMDELGASIFLLC